MLFCSEIDKSGNGETGAKRMNQNKLTMTKTQTSNHIIKLVSGGFLAKRRPDRLRIQTVLYILSVMCLLSVVFSASSGGIVEPLADGVEGELNNWIVGICNFIRTDKSPH